MMYHVCKYKKNKTCVYYKAQGIKQSYKAKAKAWTFKVKAKAVKFGLEAKALTSLETRVYRTTSPRHHFFAEHTAT